MSGAGGTEPMREPGTGFLVEPPSVCPECTKRGWPTEPEQLTGDGEPWGRGKIPAVFRKQPHPNGPLWASKLGGAKAPGASAHSAPSDISRGPWLWLEDIRTVGGIGGASLLIDAQSRVIVTTQGCIHGLGFEGKVHFGICGQRAAVAGTPALVGNLLYFTESDGTLYCYDLLPNVPVLKWSSNFCPAVNMDPSAIIANEDIVVSGGMDAKPPEGSVVNFTTHMYAMDAKTGKPRWSVKIPMPSLMLVPSIAGDSVVYMVSSGGVDCLAVKDGKAKWQVKGEMGSMSTGGAVVYGQLVFATSNKRAKKAFNAPFGGKGAARAYSLKDGSQVWEQLFDLESNCLPAICTAGPGGKTAVIVCLGSSPGQPRFKMPGVEPTGDHWNGRVVALEAQSGEILWSNDLPQWNAAAGAGNAAWSPALVTPSTGWNPPSVGADGRVYAGWNVSGTLYVLEGATGAEVSKYNFGQPMATTPVIGPGFLAIGMAVKGFGIFAQEWPVPGKILKPLEMPFTGPDGSGTEHFWPMKHNSPLCLGISKYKAPRNLTNPAWVFKTPLKLVDCWYGNSPIMDAQRNLYMGGNWSDLFVIRPDGTLRGSIYVGPYYSTPALDGNFLYVADCLGHMRCFNIETLELKWCKKYTGWTASDNYSIAIHEGSICAPGNEFLPDTGDIAPYASGKWWYDSGHRTAYRLSCETGETIWRCDLNILMRRDSTRPITVLWNFTPVIFEDYVCFMDMELGAYCAKWSDGSYVWHCQPEAKNGVMSTGNQCCGSNGLLYITGNFYDPARPACLNNPEGPGALKAFEIRTGQVRFEKHCWDDRGLHLATNQGPLLVPGRDGGRALVAAPFSNNMSGHPGDTHCIRACEEVSGKLVAFDAETGEEVWSRQWDEYWRHSHVAGSFRNDPGMVWPDSWGGLSADSEGYIYCHWQDGMVYCIDGQNGNVMARYDTGNSSNAQILLAPGMVVFTGGFGIFCFRDAELEAEWLAEAEAKGDPRAKVPLMDIPAPSEDSPPRKEWEKWRGPIYAEEQTYREGAAWAEEFARVYSKFVEVNEEWSNAQSATKKGGGSKGKGTHWVVVGGGDKGIVVRSGKDLKSDEVGRLEKGAKFEQVKKEGERIQYKKLAGEGPDAGWVSLSFKGAALVQPE